jgi:hydroxymethylbilane synthase
MPAERQEAGRATLRLGTRGSDLALAQADLVASLLRASSPGLAVERVLVKTLGDRVLDQALSRIGDKGLFTKELEAELLAGRIDLAVHSLKDVPTRLPGGLVLAAVLEREDPADVLVSGTGKRLEELPAGARVGTSSLRRRAQVLALRPDLAVVDLRGNVPTRVDKAMRGEYDAIVLARAGVRRLGLEGRVTEVFGPDRLLPAVSQGAIAVEARAADGATLGRLRALEHRATRLAVTAERALLARLEGGCQVPIGAWARLEGESLVLDALVADLDGSSVVRAREEGKASTEAEATALGTRAAERLLERGADAVLRRVAEAGGAA